MITVVDTTAPVTDTANPFAPGRETRAHATAHGKALLSRLTPRARRRYFDAHGMARLTPATITNAEAMEAELLRVRAAGFAVSVGEADPAWTCLAVALPPVGDERDTVHALSVSVPTQEFRRRPEGIRAALAEAAEGRIR